jgi:hypothetical protein
MKNVFYIGTFVLGIILATSCGQSGQQAKSLADSTTTTVTKEKEKEPVDTSDYFIRKILNCNPNEVAKQLGAPDGQIKASEDCEYLPNCYEAAYQNDKYEVLYYNNRLKLIQVNQKGLFNNNAIRFVGFQSCEPSFSSNIGIWWRSPATIGTATGPLIPIKGIREIFAGQGGIIVRVEADYNEKF